MKRSGYGKKGFRLVAILLGLGLMILGLGVFALGCGKSAGEKAVEQAIEEAAEQGGQKVDVDVENGSISISGQNTNESYQFGSNVEIPKEVPSSLIPDGAEVTFAGKQGEAGDEYIAVQFAYKTEGKEMLEFFKKELQKLGYTVSGEFSSQQGTDLVFGVTGEKDGTEISCTGAAKSGDKYVYVVQVYQGGSSGAE